MLPSTNLLSSHYEREKEIGMATVTATGQRKRNRQTLRQKSKRIKTNQMMEQQYSVAKSQFDSKCLEQVMRDESS